MASQASFNSNAVEADGIRMEIWEPDLIVLPIPKNRLGANTPVQINVSITNNTATPFPFIDAILTPELVTPEGQALHSQKLIDKQIKTTHYNGIFIPPHPGYALIRSLIAKLSWQNDSLQLQMAIFDPRRIPSNPDYFWSFEPLHLGSYQLRFTYLNPEFLFADAHTGVSSRVEGSDLNMLASPFVSLRFVETVESDYSAVEVDGIRFETFIPKQIISGTPSQFHVNIPVQIGMQITNNTPTSFRFICFDSLLPELIGVDGLVPRQSCGGSLGWVSPVESDFQLVTPGNSIILFPKAHLVWQADGLLNLVITGGGRACWKFNDLRLGTYQIRLTYRSPTEVFDLWFEDVWMGMVYSPFVQFRLVHS